MLVLLAAFGVFFFFFLTQNTFEKKDLTSAHNWIPFQAFLGGGGGKGYVRRVI